MYIDVLFSVNEYDSDGDVSEKGIFLHFGQTRVFAADNVEDFEMFSKQISNMVAEIKTNYASKV